MASLTNQELNYQNRGWVKVSNGTYVLDINSDGTLPVALVGASSVGDGTTAVTTAGTRVVLAASTTCKEVTINAWEDNTGVIVVGGATVVAAKATRRGIPLWAGDSIKLTIDDLNKVYIDSTVNGEKITYTYLN